MDLKRIGKGVGIGVVCFIVAIVVGVTISSFNQGAPKTDDKDTIFSDAAKARFATIQASIPELADIHGVDDTISSVAYFNFTKLPADTDTMIRANAVTFSNFRTQTYGVGHVTVYAQLNGKNLFHCEAASGKVTECKND